MSWFVDEKELQRQGVRILLQGMRDLAPVQSALQSLEQNVPITDIAHILRAQCAPVLDQLRTLQGELLWEKRKCETLQIQAERWCADPLHNQIAQAQSALENTTAQLQETQRTLHTTQEILERERRAHQLEAQELREQVFELNRLVAKQHKRLEALTGSDTPE